MPFNRSMEGGYGGVFGPFFVCALEEDHFGSLTTEQMATYKKKFHMAELLIGAKGNTPITLKAEPRQRRRYLTETRSQRNGSVEAWPEPPMSGWIA